MDKVQAQPLSDWALLFIAYMSYGFGITDVGIDKIVERLFLAVLKFLNTFKQT